MLRISLTAEERFGPVLQTALRRLTAPGRGYARVLAAGVLVSSAWATPDDPTVEFSATASAGAESAGAWIATLELSATSTSEITVPFTVSGSADDPADYGLDVTSPVTIPAGQLTADITITPQDDALDENDETVVLTLGTPTGATLGTDIEHTATLTDDDDPPDVQFTAASQTGDESAGALTVDLQLTAVSGLEVSVPLSAGGAATLTTDYTLSANPVVIPAGQTSATLTITVVDDSTDEEDEDAVLTIGTPANAGVGATNEHTVTVTDDDDPPSVQFAVAGMAAGENGGPVSVVVDLSAASGKEVTVPFTVGGTAVDPDDYGIVASPVVVSAGATSVNVDVTPVDDLVDEQDETVVLTLGTPTNASLGAQVVHTLTLNDQDDPPTVEFQSATTSVDESTGSATITVELSSVSGQDVTVPYTLSGTALDPDDYGLDASPLTILAGQASANLTLTVVDDDLDEDDETAILTLGTPTGADLGATTQHTATLNDDDAPPTVDFDLATQDSDEGAGTGLVTISLSEASGLDVTVPFTVDGTALDPDDYGIDASPLVIPAGSTSGEVTITVVDDALHENDETVELTLASPTNGTLGTVTVHTHSLLDDDVVPTVDFQSASQSAGEGGGPIPATVLLSAVSGLDVTVPFTVSGTAEDPDDYSCDASPVVIPAGQTSVDVTIVPADDVIYEPSETVEITLGTPDEGQLGGVTKHTLTLTSNDPPPTVEFTTASQSSSEGVGAVGVTATLSGVSGSDVFVPLLVGGTAIEGVDFTLDVNPIFIPAGQLTGSTTVTAITDALDELDETVVLTMDTPTGADLGATVVHTLTLLDDDAPPTVGFQIHFQAGDESAGALLATLQLSAPSGLDVTVPFDHLGTADAGSDYTISGSPAVILAGQTTTDIVVTLIDDLEDENLERLRVRIIQEQLVNATPGSIKGHRINIRDDDGTGTGKMTLPLRPDTYVYALPAVEVGQSTPPQTITVTNTQTVPITFDGIALEGLEPADYQVSYGQAMPFLVQPGQSATFDVVFTAGAMGPRDATAVISQTPSSVHSGAVDLRGIGIGLPGDEIRMNAGPDEYLDVQRALWTADFSYVGDSAYTTTPFDILGTEDDALYSVGRTGNSFGYAFELADGDYDVVLHFAEWEYAAAGQRVMNVDLEGAPAIVGLDLIAAVGAYQAWDTGPIRTTVTGGTLDIDLWASAGDAIVSAIEVRSVPVMSADPSDLDFGVVDQGLVAQLNLNLTNTGLVDAKATQLAFVLDGAGQGTGEDFYVRIGQTDYYGGVSTVYYAIDLDLPAGFSTQLQVFFEPSEHQVNDLRVEFVGDFETLSIDLSGTGGADADWGFLHPVIEHSPALVVDYDEDGSEEVDFVGFSSHTHEPGQVLASYEWFDDSVSFSTQVNDTHTILLGPNTIELTITDDKVPADTATHDISLPVHSPDDVPGILASYYDGMGDPVFLLDNVPTTPDYMERISSLLIAEQNGLVGGSPFSGDVMVRWEAQFDVTVAAVYDFMPTGGADHRIEVDGQRWGGASTLLPGTHDLELRFAVIDTGDLTLELDVSIDGQQASSWSAGLTHDARPLPPIIHDMPTVGTELGGNLITITGFAFFPKDQVTVHWGAIDLTESDFISWTSEQIDFYSPPGTGSIQVTVETPNGVSGARTFTYSPDGPVPVSFDRLDDKELPVNNPTTATWHAGRLYVGTLEGFIHEFAFDEDWNVTSSSIHAGVSGLTNFDVCGIAVNPYDPADPVKLYVAHGEHFLNGGGAFQGESPFTGQVSVLTGPSFDTPVPLITQLPTSNHDHGVNGMVFDNNGDLLISMGGNTNAGVRWPLLGDLPGSPFSGAILKAETSRIDFNGAIQYVAKGSGNPVSDQVLGRNIESDGTAHIEVHAAGFRNSYDLALTTRGLLFSTDNGPNKNYGAASTGPNSNSGKHPEHDDEVNLVRRGSYYGHANRNRGDEDYRQHVWRDIDEPSDEEFTQAIHTIPSSACGLTEYRAQTFKGQIRGQLVVQKWNANQRLLELSDNGEAVVNEVLLSPLAPALDVITAPGGALIGLDYTGDLVRFLEPDDASAIGLTVHDVHPWRTLEPGGTPFVIGGEAFIDGQTTVTVDGVPATVTSVTPRRIHGIFPALNENNVESLYDIEVTVGLDQAVLPACVLCLPANPGEMKGFWTTGTPMPDALGEVACGVVGTTMYVFGEGTNKTYAYDLLNHSWSDTLAVRPFPGNHHACEVIGDKLYLFGGFGGGAQGKVQIYDPATDLWTTGANMPWNGASCSSGVIGGLAYVCGGIVGNATVTNLSVYDPVADDWDQGGGLSLAPMITEVNHAASASDGTVLWIFGGRQGGNVPQPGFDTVQCYDPVTDTWDSSDQVQSTLTPMPLGRGGTGRAVLYKGELYVFGGESDVDVFPEVQVYRPLQNTWRDETGMPTPRHGVFPVVFQSRMFLAGGGTTAGFSQTDVLEIFQRP